MSAEEIVFEIISDGAGPQRVSYKEGKISYNGALYDELTFEAQTEARMFAEPSFILHDVTIGVDFHWERKVTRKYAGTLRFIADEGKVTAVNIIGIEDYLLSVISCGTGVPESPCRNLPFMGDGPDRPQKSEIG